MRRWWKRFRQWITPFDETVPNAERPFISASNMEHFDGRLYQRVQLRMPESWRLLLCSGCPRVFITNIHEDLGVWRCPDCEPAAGRRL